MPTDPFETLKSHFADLSAGQQRVARMLLDEPARVALLSTAALGQRAGVSDSTVVRLASAVGYSGYPELRAAIHQSLFQHVPPSEHLRRALRESRNSAVRRSLQTDLHNVEHLRAEAIHNAIMSASAAIASASAVYVAGSQSSFAPAFTLYYLLGRVLENVHLVTAAASDLAYELVGMTSGAILVAFSVPRYSHDTYAIARHAEELGVSIIAVTDSFTSPIAQLKSTAISVDCESSSFFRSQVASISVANAIASEVAQQMAVQAESRLQKFESLDHSFGRLVLDGKGGQEQRHES